MRAIVRHTWWLCLAGAVIGSCVLAYQIGSTPRPPVNAKSEDHEIGGLAVPAGALDVGEVWEEKAFSWHFPIYNRTNANIQILDFAVSCACLHVEPRSLTIAPGKSAFVGMKFDLTHRMPWDVGRAKRPFSYEITPLLNRTMARAPGWVLHGVIKSRLTLNTLAVNFGEEAVHGQPPIARKIMATLHVPVDRVEAVVNPNNIAKAHIQPHPENPHEFYVLIAPDTGLPPGSFKGEVIIEVVGPNGDRLPAVTLPIAGEMQPEIGLLPARLLLGSRPVGETAEAIVVMQAPPGTAVLVERIETDSRDTDVEAVALNGTGTGPAFRIRQRVTQEGDHGSVVRFVLRKDAEEAVSMTTYISYHGEPAGGRAEANSKVNNP